MEQAIEAVARALYLRQQSWRTASKCGVGGAYQITEPIPFDAITAWRRERLLADAAAALGAVAGADLLMPRPSLIHHQS